MVDWYLAPSLATGRTEVNARWPNRDRTSDGTIGDESHQTRVSDHNPNSRGSVNAWDIDVNGVDIPLILRAFERHPSAHYWIYNRRIADKDNDWTPTQYTGTNPHTAHAHLSIYQALWAEQDRRPWEIFPTKEEDLLPDERRALMDIRHALTSIDPPEGGDKIHNAVAMERLLGAANALQVQQSSMHTSIVHAISGIKLMDPEAFADALARSPEALAALTSAMKAQLPLIPTAQEVAKAVLVWISAGVHNGAPS